MEDLTVSLKPYAGERVGGAEADGAPDPRALPLRELAAACGAELAAFRSGQPSRDGYGLELFRRAVCERDAAAWAAAVRAYRGLVLHWLRQHPAGAAAREAADDRAVRAFERFWRAVTPARFAGFGHLAGLLRYLKLCAHSVLIDDLRERTAVASELGPAGPAAAAPDATANPERQVLDRLTRDDLWQAVGRALPDAADRRLIYLSFALGLTPRQIAARHPKRYPDVAAVYRVKRNALERLRRASALCRLME
jgi:hypothetical protein